MKVFIKARYLVIYLLLTSVPDAARAKVERIWNYTHLSQLQILTGLRPPGLAVRYHVRKYPSGSRTTYV